LAVDYFLGATILKKYVLRAFDITVSTVFCWYGTCINQQLQRTCLLQQSDIVWWIGVRALFYRLETLMGVFQVIKMIFLVQSSFHAVECVLAYRAAYNSSLLIMHA